LQLALRVSIVIRSRIPKSLGGTAEWLEMPADIPLIEEYAASFNAEINGTYGLYLDATAGFAALFRRLEETQQEAGATDDSLFFYGRGAPGTPENVLQHQTTQGILKARIQEGGGNYFRLARLVVVMLYELWETGYRRPLASAAGVRPEDLLVSVFGDLRLLRHEILHNKARLTPETTAKLEVLQPPDSATVDLHEGDVERIVWAMKAAIDELVKTWTGRDPAYRTRLRID
jgi:hypothetical protein